MNVKRIEHLFSSIRQRVKVAKLAKAIGWTVEGDLFEYTIDALDKEVAELEMLLGLKEEQTNG